VLLQGLRGTPVRHRWSTEPVASSVSVAPARQVWRSAHPRPACARRDARWLSQLSVLPHPCAGERPRDRSVGGALSDMRTAADPCRRGVARDRTPPVRPGRVRRGRGPAAARRARCAAALGRRTPACIGTERSARAAIPRFDMSGSPRLEELRAEARYARERYDLYRARMHGPRQTSATRLRELERMHLGADARLRRAEQDRRDSESNTAAHDGTRA
jgi:hypothetical protein